MNAATMSDSSSVANGPKSEIYEALTSIRLIDPHSHINPHSPASTTLADVLGYHYYTELAHSAGMPKSQIEDKAIGPKSWSNVWWVVCNRSRTQPSTVG